MDAVEHITSIVGDLLNILQTRPSGEIVLRLALLVLVATARIPSRTYSGFRDGYSGIAALILSVFGVIERTNQMGLVSDFDPYLSALESAITHFAVSFRREYFASDKPPIDQIYCLIKRSRKDAFDLFVGRLLNDLSRFTLFPDLLEQILAFFETLLCGLNNETDSLKELISQNEVLQGLIQRRLFLGFSELSDVSKARRFVAMLNRIYARAIKSPDAWKQFLLFFDEQFEKIQAKAFQDGKDIFFLYREIYGAIKGAVGLCDYLLVFRWFIRKHFRDTVNALRAHVRDVNVTGAIFRTWYLICSNPGKKLVLPAGSSEGLTLFHCTLEIIEILSENGSEANLMMICKMIRPSMCEKYANFGVMQLYHDESLAKMIGGFFAILEHWDFQSIAQIPKALSTILMTIESITTVCPQFLSEARFELVCDFLWRCLLIPSDEKGEVFKLACSCLKGLMEYLLNIPDKGLWHVFRPHFVALLDSLITSERTLGDFAACPICFIMKMDGEFVQRVFERICGSFDEQFRGGVSDQLSELLAKTAEVSSPDQISKFRRPLNSFKSAVLKYAIRLSNIPEFVQFFGGGEDSGVP
jgi:hypothetical protein